MVDSLDRPVHMRPRRDVVRVQTSAQEIYEREGLGRRGCAEEGGHEEGPLGIGMAITCGLSWSNLLDEGRRLMSVSKSASCPRPRMASVLLRSTCCYTPPSLDTCLLYLDSLRILSAKRKAYLPIHPKPRSPKLPVFPFPPHPLAPLYISHDVGRRTPPQSIWHRMVPSKVA
jgi:hypothetical protein